MIGLSVSFCISDIINGKVQESAVEKIVAGTCAYTMKDWEPVIQQYRKSYWRVNPELGEAICWRFIAAGIIDQPRTNGQRPPYIQGGYWVENKSEIHFRE